MIWLRRSPSSRLLGEWSLLYKISVQIQLINCYVARECYNSLVQKVESTIIIIILTILTVMPMFGHWPPWPDDYSADD